MSLEIVLVTPRRRFIANHAGLGYQMPLGHVFLGGALVGAGHRVRLLDNDVLGWSEDRLACELSRRRPDCIFLGHTGSTAAHPAAVATARAIKRRMPQVPIAYGGPYPSYMARPILEEVQEIDVIARGEGEETAAELVEALDEGPDALGGVKGITWRDGEVIRANPDRPPIADLDRFHPGWELVDWDAYQLFGFGRSAGMQFSRGCPLRCSYCGQWSFWRKWRHRSPQSFADELELLARRHRVRIVWLADENFAAGREAAREAIEMVASRDLGLSINLNMTAADVVRDADLMPLYKRAGVDNVVMGVESLENSVVGAVGKDNPFEVSREAVRILRRHGIVSLVNIIYGLEEETLATAMRTFRRLLQFDPDVLNAVYLTPHPWTAAGRATPPEQVIESDLRFHTYRNQVVRSGRLAPWQLFLCVKATEAAFHLRPRALVRLVLGGDARTRRILRGYLAAGARVVAAEAREFFGRSHRPGKDWIGCQDGCRGGPRKEDAGRDRATPRPSHR
jgi:anaerobic magnesium-protoporphyrin IX monomethyl ester cyclase